MPSRSAGAKAQQQNQGSQLAEEMNRVRAEVDRLEQRETGVGGEQQRTDPRGPASNRPIQKNEEQQYRSRAGEDRGQSKRQGARRNESKQAIVEPRLQRAQVTDEHDRN